MVTDVVDLKKLAKVSLRLLHRFDVPEHFSQSKNEQYSLHQMLILFVLYCLLDQPIDRFGELVKILDLSILGLEKAPHYTMMWRAWRRFPPRMLRMLVKRSGEGGRDKCISIDPTFFQITKPSIGYCKRITKTRLLGLSVG